MRVRDRGLRYKTAMLFRVFLILLSFTMPALASGEDNAAISRYLESVTARIQESMHAVQVTGSGAACDVHFAIPRAGGSPDSVFVTYSGNTQWDEYVKDRLKDISFSPLPVQKGDSLEVSARISYFPNSDKPQPGVVYRNAAMQDDVPAFRVAGRLFYYSIALCGAVCVLVQTLIIVVGATSIASVRRTTDAPSRTDAKTDMPPETKS